MIKATNRSIRVLRSLLLLFPMTLYADIDNVFYLSSLRLFESAGLPYSENVRESDIGVWRYDPASDTVFTGKHASANASKAFMLHENAHAFLFKLRDRLPESVATAKSACDQRMASSRYGDGFPEGFPDILATSLGGKITGRFFVRMREKKLSESGYRPYATRLLTHAVKSIDWSDVNVLGRAARATQKACGTLPFLREGTLSELVKTSHRMRKCKR